MKTQLDQLLIDAINDPEQFENAYYDLFLNSVLYIPTWDIPDQEGEIYTEENTEIRPVILEEDGQQFIMLFDTEARLSEWANGRELGIAGLQGFSILQILGSQFHLVLNVLSEQSKEFSPEEIEWLLSAMKPEAS